MFDSLQAQKFMVVAVAEESRGAEHARPWIEQAGADYWCLIDPDHRVAALYGMVNVPQCVWIDAGRPHRPPAEDRGIDRSFPPYGPRHANPGARACGGAHSPRALPIWMRCATGCGPAGTRWIRRRCAQRLPRWTADIALAHAHFRLGVWLRRAGRAAEAQCHLDEASRLHPDSWNIWRQAADLDEVGKASGAEFWARVRALGDRAYYQPPDLEELPG